MQTRTLVIVGVAVLLLLVAGLTTVILLNKKQAIPSAPTQANPFVFTSTDTGTGTTQQRVVYTSTGTRVTVPDFAQQAPHTVIGESADDIQYNLTPYPEYVPGTPYPTHEFDVSFNQKNSEFLVVLNQEPLGHARIAAEAFIAQRLGVTAQELCAYSITITVPHEVNERYWSYDNLGVSSCAGSVRLP